MMIKPLNVLALMSSTSFESIKYALILTDGIDIYQTYLLGEMPIAEFLRSKIELILDKDINNPDDKILIETVENDVTALICDITKEIISSNPQKIDLIGIAHNVQKKYTYQLAKGQQIFQSFHIPTVSHFHNADLLNGGQGSPINATYYQTLSADLEKPVLFINIGGISSLTYIGNLGEMISFDCGPGNAMLNDYMKKHAHVAMDYNGKMAALGTSDHKIVNGLMRHDFFSIYPPKALNRVTFKDKEEHFEGLSIENGAATIVDFITEAIVQSVKLMLPEKPETTVICGGGAMNPTIVRTLKQKLKQENITAFAAGPDIAPDDAAAIAFLAARRFYCLPITFPSTTGVFAPLTGGKIYDKDDK